jgi:hypothetical protein
MVSELLARPTDRHIRAYTLITRANQAILQLWGVRFLLVNDDLAFGAKRLTFRYPPVRAGYPQGVDPDLHINELPEPNLGNYSPTQAVDRRDAAAVVATMKSSDFDGRRTVLVDRPLEGAFVPASETVMMVEPGGFSIRATSAGESLLVLPVQYSNCWQIEGQSGAELFRANLLQLGIRFSGTLSVRLRQVFGPFGHSACRLRDAEDMHRLDVSAARTRR